MIKSAVYYIANKKNQKIKIDIDETGKTTLTNLSNKYSVTADLYILLKWLNLISNLKGENNEV